MEHSFVDKYSKLNSLVHRLDPRVKIICILAYVVSVVLTPPSELFEFALFFLLIMTVVFVSRVPVLYVLKRSAAILPFVLMVIIFIPFFKEGSIAFSLNAGPLKINISREGSWIAWNVFVKSWLSVLGMIFLISVTEFQMLLKGLEKLYLPRVFIMILAFMYRYIFVIVDEAMRMERACRSRYFGGHFFRQARIVGNMIGLLFIRSYDRGERIYQSMCARGFKGDIKTYTQFGLTFNDAGFSAAFLGAVFLIKIRGLC